MATQSNKLRAMDASVRIFVDCRGQPTRQYTVKNHAAHMPKWVCVCVCVRHKTQMPATSRWPQWPPPGWAVMSGADAGTGSRWKGHGRGEDRGREGKRKWPKTAKFFFFFSFFTSQEGGYFCESEKDIKRENMEGGREVWIYSRWGFHGNLPTSAFWTALQTQRQQMVNIGIVFRDKRADISFPSEWNYVIRVTAAMRESCRQIQDSTQQLGRSISSTQKLQLDEAFKERIHPLNGKTSVIKSSQPTRQRGQLELDFYTIT